MTGFTSNSADLSWQPIAIPVVCFLISFLGYSSQLLFHFAESLEPGPLTTIELGIFNVLLFCVWITYYKACTVNPGNFVFFKQKADLSPKPSSRKKENEEEGMMTSTAELRPKECDDASNIVLQSNRPLQPPRWCRKCAAPKPARAHHCRHCKRCIPKMDHHCPWTANCVSFTTFPHFLRFLVYSNLALSYFLYFLLFPRFCSIYHNRNLPYYLGPSMSALVHLVLVMLVGCVTEFALFVMLVTTIKSWVVNTTMIESWEIDRHEALMAKGNRCTACPHPNAGSEDSDFEDDHCAEYVEFPYDLGFFDNMAQGMGSRNPLAWFLPLFGSTTQLSKQQDGSGWSWPENGFNDYFGMWPPIDSEKQREERAFHVGNDYKYKMQEFDESHKNMSNEEIKAAFKARQEADLIRQKSRILAELEEVEDYDMIEDTDWTNENGEGITGFGVNVDSDMPQQPERSRLDDGPSVIEIQEDEEDVPLAEIVRRRRQINHKKPDE